MQERTAVEDGAAIMTGERTRWKAELRVAAITGAAEVVLEISPTAASGAWTQIATFGAVSAIGTTKLDSTKDSSDFTTQVTDRDIFLRARLATIGTDVTFDVVVDAPFLDWTFAEDLRLLPKELRNWEDGLERTVEQAETDVVLLLAKAPTTVEQASEDLFAAPIITPDPLGVQIRQDAPRGIAFDADLTIRGVGKAIKFEIARQATHLYTRHRLSTDGSHEAQRTWRNLGHLAPGLGKSLRGYRPKSREIVRGR